MSGWAGFARLGGVGDNFIASVVLRPLKTLGYKTEVLTSAHAGAVFRNNPFIDKLSIIPEGIIPGDKWQEWFVNRGKEYELFAHLSHTCEVRHALQTGQTSFWWRPEYRRVLCAGSYLETPLDILGLPHEFGPLYFPTEEERLLARDTISEKIKGPYIAWVIRGSRIDKLYPYAAMAIGRITKELGIPVVMLGGGEEQVGLGQQIKDHVERQNSTRDMVYIALPTGGGVITGVRPVLAMACEASLVITPDTGIAWAVAMEQMPKIVLLSHASEENITKHWVNTTPLHADPARIPCWPCHRLHNDISTCTPNKDGGHAAACISDISVETIIENVRKCLKM